MKPARRGELALAAALLSAAAAIHASAAGPHFLTITITPVSTHAVQHTR